MQAGGYTWREFEWQARAPDARTERLCAETNPDRLADKRRLDCTIEGAAFAPRDVPPQDEIVVMAYNVERGYRMDEQVRLLQAGPGLPRPDVILMSEADRGCSRTAYRNIAREYAEALGMDYVFGVEFVELPRCFGDGKRVDAPCEHGNAILSRYPLGNVRLIRHRISRSWYSRWQRLLRVGEPRLGGRMALAADVQVGERHLHLYSLHWESGRANGSDRTAQALELAEDGLRQPFGVILGGDTNAAGPDEPALRELLSRGYADAHSALDSAERVTTRSGVAIDRIFGRGVAFTGAGIGPPALWGGLSDHLPVWARVRMDPPNGG